MGSDVSTGSSSICSASKRKLTFSILDFCASSTSSALSNFF